MKVALPDALKELLLYSSIRHDRHRLLCSKGALCFVAHGLQVT